ncbi:MAG: saccharopine dehydrogenase NADP-binding domain-containing protein [Euryarchaeota archaeon]|nr:saccharopine dehydrogenase NADP-binding domain-containing protein [Euryarchaeota archaeon]
MVQKVVVLGAGRVGKLVAITLAEDRKLEVTALDRDEKAIASLPKNVRGRRADLSPKNVKGLVKGADLVVNAVPGFMGFAVLREIIGAGRDCCDFSFMPEDAMRLGKAAERKGVVAAFDCGIAPGFSNMIVGRMAADRRLESVEIMVGGLPTKKTNPFGYKALFSPIDVIEEYVRPARLVRNYKPVSMPALTELELVDLPCVGILEAFNTDGLRSLIGTVKARNMTERTLRYPGHAEKVGMLREVGFFNDDVVEVRGAKVRPIDMTAKLLFPMWQLRKGEDDLTVMRVVGEGEGRRETWDILDRSTKGISSMARTTGYTAVIVAKMILNGDWDKPGVSPPEYIGREKRLFDKAVRQMKGYGIGITKK